MIKNNKIFNLLKTMIKTSYDSSNILDSDTKRINKKSIRVWIISITCIITLYLSYMIINSLKAVGASEVFLDIFFMILQVLVMFESILLNISIMYFSQDTVNYLSLPITNTKLMVTKYFTMLSIILGSEVIIALPSIFIYGLRTVQSIWFYPLVMIILLLVTVFFTSLTSIIMILMMRLFRFIKNKNLYQSIIVFLMTFIILFPLSNVYNVTINNIENSEITEVQEESTDELINISEIIKKSNKIYLTTELGVRALSEINFNSVINTVEILGLAVLTLMVLFSIGRYTYIKDVLWVLSLFDKKNNKKVRLKSKCKVKNKNYAYLRNEIKNIIKSPTYFMHYVYNIIIVLFIIIMITLLVFPIMIQALVDARGEEIFNDLSFGFKEFSLIIGIIQVIFTFSSISLTAISRYGKNTIFFKYIPIKLKTQFRLKNVPQIIINTLIIISVLATIHYLIPAIQFSYIILMFIVAMLLNIINSNILLLIDLFRPQLNYINEVSVIKQNDNKMFQYILSVVSCLIIWYLEEVTESLSLNTSIIIEIILYLIIILGMEIFINKKSNRLFKNII